MRVEMELDFEKYCSVGMSPRTVLPSNHHYSGTRKRNSKEKSACRSNLLSIEEDFADISFGDCYSVPYKSISYRPAGVEGNVKLKRASMYQSSEEISKKKKMRAIERRKIELSRSSDSSLLFRIVDSLCSSDEENPVLGEKRSPVKSLNSDLSASSFRKPCSLGFSLPSSPSQVLTRGDSSDGFFEIGLDLGCRENHPTETAERDSIRDSKFKCDEVVGPQNDSNDVLERETILSLHKSLSAKVLSPYSPSQSERDRSWTRPRARFNPIRKMFDPFSKSKSQRSTHSVAKPGLGPTGLVSGRNNKTFQQSLLHDLSNTTQHVESASQIAKEFHHSAAPCSPAHLHGYLNLDTKHGEPCFEFSLKHPEDVFVAKTWKANNAFNWVYTFHSIHNRKKSNTSAWGLKDCNKETSMVGQMQISCYLCSELQDSGKFGNSTVTEFVLYDIAHARKNITDRENSNCTPHAVEHAKGSSECLVGQNLALDDASDAVKLKCQKNHASNNDDFDAAAPHPWPPENLHPDLEIAAIVIQVPFGKRESLKFKRGEKISNKLHSDPLDFPMVEQNNKEALNISPAKLKVVTASGNHGFQSGASRGPSPLLDRWRLGGGCDCGGWDMACPLVVLDNPCIHDVEDCSHMEYQQQPLELYVQGAKERMPALTLTNVEEGQYVVDFHAQLSTLQAFSICVAMLHSSEAFPTAGDERNRRLLQCNSLKMLIEEEVKFLIEAVAEEEKRRVPKPVEGTLLPFVFNPSFSPIARV